jgi:hypothetical protein
MNRPNLRNAIIILTLITALVHFYLNFNTGTFVFQPIFTLNALGYLALLVALFWPPAFLAGMLKGRETLLHYVFIGYTAVTIVAYFAINGAGGFTNVIGLGTKVVEALLIFALWQHLRSA